MFSLVHKWFMQTEDDIILTRNVYININKNINLNRMWCFFVQGMEEGQIIISIFSLPFHGKVCAREGVT